MVNEHLSDDELRALTPEREHHLSICTDCRRRLIELRDSVESRPLPSEALAAAKRIGRPRLQPWTWAAAAMITVAVLSVAVTRPWKEDIEVMRDAPSAAALRLVSPADRERVSASEVELRWAPVEGAMRYEVRVLDARGDVVAEEDTTETRAGVGGRVEAGQSYFWSVRARQPDGRVTDSEVRSFVVD